MKRDDWRRAYEPLPASLEYRVSSTLRQIEEGKPMKKFTIRTASLVMALILALAGTAWALEQWGITNFLSDHYGETLSPEATGLVQTEFSNPSLKVGDLTFTLREMIADAYVGMAVVECKAPEGKYIYTDLVQMTAEEWEMTEADRFKKFGDYYWLLDTNIVFDQNGERLDPVSEYAMDGVREADNVIVMQCTFPVGAERDISKLIIDVAVRHVKGDDMTAGEKFEGDFIPGYKLDTSSYKTYKKAVNNGVVKDVTVTITPLMLHADVTLEKALENQHTLVITDKDGKEFDFTYLGSFGAGYGSEVITNACGIPETLPGSVFVQLAQYDNETGEPVPVGDRVEIELK